MPGDVEALPFFEYNPVIEFRNTERLCVRLGFQDPLACGCCDAGPTVRHHIVGGLLKVEPAPVQKSVVIGVDGKRSSRGLKHREYQQGVRPAGGGVETALGNSRAIA